MSSKSNKEKTVIKKKTNDVPDNNMTVKQIRSEDAQQISTSNIKTISPYITTVLSTTILLTPQQLDENMYNHLKQNLIKKMEGKCYRNFGYISKIYQIKSYGDGMIVPENPMAGVLYDINFSCRLCNPLKNKEIVCEVFKIKGMLINAVNGPITVIVTLDRINGEIFYYDAITNKLMVKSTDNTTSHEVKQRTQKESGLSTSGSYVKILIENKKIYDSNNIIYTIGKLTGIANEDEIKEFYDAEYGVGAESNTVDFNEYIDGENPKKAQLEPVAENEPTTQNTEEETTD